MIYAANWKLYKTPTETRDFLQKFLSLHPKEKHNEVVVFPTAICLEAAAETLKGSDVRWGAQNCYFEKQGAFTGENSVDTVKSLGGQYILIGHSERRTLFGEMDELLSKKVKFVQDMGLTPMLCIGETLQERESGKTQEVVTRQLRQSLKLMDKQKPLTIAYEPVWAIGTGKVASSEQVAEAHQQVRNVLKELGVEKSPILYGGSVKPQNSTELAKLKNVDGFLIGGASLEVDSFSAICRSLF